MPTTIFQTPGFGTGGTGTVGSTGDPRTQKRNYNAPGFDDPQLQNAMNALLSQQLMQIYGMPPQRQIPGYPGNPPPVGASTGNQVTAQAQQSPAAQAVMQAIKGTPTQQGGGGQLRK